MIRQLKLIWLVIVCFTFSLGMSQIANATEQEWRALIEKLDNIKMEGRLSEAEALAQQALQLAVTTFGGQTSNTAKSLFKLGEILFMQGASGAPGKSNEAITLVRKALEIEEKTLGGDHPDTAGTMSFLGMWLILIPGNNVEGEALIRTALAINEKALGAEHPTTALTLGQLAIGLVSLKKYAEAEALSRRALAINEKALGIEHPMTNLSMTALMMALQAQGKNAEVEQLSRRMYPKAWGGEKSTPPPGFEKKLKELEDADRTRR